MILWPLGERWRKGRVIAREDNIRLWWLGVLAIPINQGFFLYGLQWTTAGHSALLYGLTPMFVLVLAAWQLGERITRWRAAGIILAFVGVAVVLFEQGIVLSRRQFTGDVLVLVAVAAWALYTVWCKPLVRKYGGLVVTARSLAYGTILFIPIGLFAIGDFEPASVAWDAWGGLLYTALLTSVFSYTIWNWSLGYIDAAQVAVFNNFQPVIAAVLGWVLLDEPLTAVFILGGILVLIGVYITEKR